jgi:preprotein translocase subunit SecF
MAETHKKLRYLIPPGTSFDFLGISRPINIISLLLLVGSVVALIANYQIRGEVLNWTIDFEGGTEVILAPQDAGGAPRTLEIAAVRDALTSAGHGEDEVSSMRWTEEVAGARRDVEGLVIRTTRFGAVTAERAAAVDQAIRDKLADRQVLSSRWSGDTLFLRTKRAIPEADLAPIFTGAGLELKPPDAGTRAQNLAPDEGTGEYRIEVSAWGLDRELERLLERAFSGTDVRVVQSYAVGAKASEDLFYNGLRAIIYAMGLIMLYLAFRFDIRYAPGAMKATVHDAFIVVGVLAVTWTPISLSTLAALLTIVGYSTNDTAIIFDRIRENMRVHKDKTIERIVNLSLNEVLGRSILTSLFVFAVTLMMNIFGDGVLANFAFVLNVGVIVSAASTIFLSAPVFVWISKKWYSGPPRRRQAPAPAPAAADADAR